MSKLKRTTMKRTPKLPEEARTNHPDPAEEVAGDLAKMMFQVNMEDQVKSVGAKNSATKHCNWSVKTVRRVRNRARGCGKKTWGNQTRIPFCRKAYPLSFLSVQCVTLRRYRNRAKAEHVLQICEK